MHNTNPCYHSSKIFNLKLSRVALALICAAICYGPNVFADTLIWNGGGTTANWSDSGNWFGVVPANGDTLVFQGGQPKPFNTNNIVGLTLGQIRFIGATGGYTIVGNSFALSNNVSSIECTNTAGINTFSNDIVVPSANLVVNVAPSAKLFLSGALSGSGGVIKNGAGTITLAGRFSNTYSGTTTVNNGLMELQKDGISFTATAIPGNMVIGNAINNATVRNLEPSDIADSANVTINLFGLWDLNNFSETIGTNLTISGGLSSGTGLCILSPSPTITIPNGANGTISGNLNISTGTCTIQDDGNLDLNAVVSGLADIIKNGIGSLHFAAANTFTGSVTANGQNYIWVTHALGLGTTAGGTTLNDQTWLALAGNLTVANESLTFNSSYAFGTLYGYATDTNTWTGPVVFNTNITILTFTNCGLVLSGPLSGPGGFTKLSPGVLRLSGSPSSYFGDTTVNEGILLLNAGNVIRHGTLTIGDGIGGPNADLVRYLSGGCIFGGPPDGSTVVIKSSGWLDLNNFFDDVGPITMDGGQITTGSSGTLRLFQPFNTVQTDSTNGTSIFTGNLDLFQTSTFGMSNFSTLSISGPVTSSSAIGSSSLIKNGNGNLLLQSSNSYTGPTIIQEGILYAENASALGTTNSGTVVSNNATLALFGANLGITNEPLWLNGNGVSTGWGNLDIETGGTNFWVGPMTLNVDSTVTAYYSSPSVLHIISGINGPGGFTTLPAGTGIIYMDGTAANTYAGTTRVFGGTLLLDKTPFDGSIPHDLIVGDGFGGVNADVVRNLIVNQIPNLANVTINSSGLLDLGTAFDGIGTITGTGNMNLGNQFVDMYGTTTYTFDGVISGTGYFRQVATGTAILTGNNTYTGPTIVNSAGAIYVNGSQPQSAVQVNTSSGSFGGSGVVGEIFCNGHLRPGNSPGILTCSNLTFTASAVYHEEISGRVPGLGYDQMNVRGTNNLANAGLNISVPLSNGVSVGDQIVMINNDGVDPITGIFAGYGPGASFLANGFTFVISYTGGTGNDVVFTVTSVPGDVVSGSVAAGNGDHIIGPNECNNFSVEITNKTGSPMTGVTAVLSASTPGVEITQPYSSYPNVPANGKGTNTAPFQISTLPSFVCGSDISLQLTVHPLSHGAFTVPFVIHSGAPAAIPNRFDNSVATNLLDTGTIESTNVVTGIATPLAKVVVSLWLGAPIDSDMSISLISPNGTTVNLTSGNGGSSPNFGTACSPDSSRTTFDDSAPTSITAGSAPFVGAFRPQAPLSAFFETPVVNGNWRLRLTDPGFAGNPDTLRCWSLFLYPLTCAPGSGLCALCSPPIAGTITTNDPVEVNRLFRNGVISSCGTLKDFPGISGANLHYDAYTFTNTTGADACVTVELAASCDVFGAAYLGSFDPTNIANNYLGDTGTSTSPANTNAFSFNVPAGATFVVVVNEVNPNVGCDNYAITLSGLPCPAPALSVEDLPGANAHLFWPNSAGGYILESSPLVEPATWSAVTNEPINNGGNYNITNTTTAPSQFFRLHKP